MLKMIERSEFPDNRRGRGPVRLFAEREVQEFVGSSEAGQVAEVTGWPEQDGDGRRKATRRALALRAEIAAQKAPCRAFQRGERVFLERRPDGFREPGAVERRGGRRRDWR